MVAGTSTANSSAPATFDQTQYKEKSRKLVTLVNQLWDAGAQASFTLPSLVVCGNQSAGKSSLLERLCGVKLPRAAGTCTKCPTEVRLSTAAPLDPSSSWCCQVKLRKEYGKDNNKLDTKPKEEVFATLNQDSKDLLHFYVLAAQKALLNPDTPTDIFARDADCAAAASSTSTSSSSAGSNADSADDLKFTRNVVVLEITGADVDLALIDLPGIIQTEQGDDGSNVELVKQLVDQYISSSRSIIVATITCKDDIDNQAVMQMARGADKEGLRTIGVLTKADTIEPGTHGTWLSVLQGAHYRLKLGYYCVVNPSQEDINKGMSPAGAAAKEAAFFQQDPFFSSEAVAGMADHFGVDALRVQLSKQLVSLTQRELPNMKAALEEVLEQTEQQLRKLPPAPASDPSFELFRRLRDLINTIEHAIDGTDNAVFYRAADGAYRALRAAVLQARPTVRLTEFPHSSSSDSGSTGSAGAAAAGSPSSDGAAVPDSGTPVTRKPGLKEEDPQFWLQGPAHSGKDKPEGLITLKEVEKLAARDRVQELPSFPPYRVLEELVQGLKGCWDAAAITCLHSVAEELTQLTERAVDEHFGQFAAARREIRALLYALHERLLTTTEQQIRQLMAMEKQQTWTQNDHYFVSSKQCFEELLVKQLYGSGKASKPDDTAKNANGQTARQCVDAALAHLATAGIVLSAEDLDIAVAKKKRKAAEQDRSLLDLIAGTLAYFKVSSKRVIDGVPMHLRHYLLQQFVTELSDLPAKLASGMSALSPVDAGRSITAGDNGAAVCEAGGKGSKGQQGMGVGVGGADGTAGSKQGSAAVLDAAKLMSEDESTAERRAQLQRQREQLLGVKMILSVF